jgi:hypothetical protein
VISVVNPPPGSPQSRRERGEEEVGVHREDAKDAKCEIGFTSENRVESPAKIPLPQWERVVAAGDRVRASVTQ